MSLTRRRPAVAVAPRRDPNKSILARACPLCGQETHMLRVAIDGHFVLKCSNCEEVVFTGRRVAEIWEQINPEGYEEPEPKEPEEEFGGLSIQEQRNLIAVSKSLVLGLKEVANVLANEGHDLIGQRMLTTAQNADSVVEMYDVRLQEIAGQPANG